MARRLHHELGYRTTGIDISPSAVALAIAHDEGLAPGPAWRCADITTSDLTALPKPAYAVITCRLVYRWMDSKAESSETPAVRVALPSYARAPGTPPRSTSRSTCRCTGSGWCATATGANAPVSVAASRTAAAGRLRSMSLFPPGSRSVQLPPVKGGSHTPLTHIP
ncbi:hypothetical protein [Streptomyces sp. NPDC060054]|uniref:hypothetical protein n=1 Tax=Streptomyces sp. NPDC060054 TaxID=3347048 RepID=UPI0036A6347B